MPVLGDDVDGVDDVSGVVERVKVGPVAQVISLNPVRWLTWITMSRRTRNAYGRNAEELQL
jgi:hypothetical protein